QPAADAPATASASVAASGTPGTPAVADPYLAGWLRLTPERRPVPLKPGVDYGMDPATGQFVWPKAAPEVHQGQRFPGELSTWDNKSYAKNVK
ncbi:hypothetical protein FH726_24130, partial [Bacteroides thetaiotaomicron]|nr:hypothetical protein [Bacteroides thetaiotaomicron]